jgi:hypothetical protein
MMMLLAFVQGLHLKHLYCGYKYNQNDQVKEDEMGRACSTNGGEEECMSDIGGKARRNETIKKTKI